MDMIEGEHKLVRLLNQCSTIVLGDHYEWQQIIITDDVTQLQDLKENVLVNVGELLLIL